MGIRIIKSKGPLEVVLYRKLAEVDPSHELLRLAFIDNGLLCLSDEFSIKYEHKFDKNGRYQAFVQYKRDLGTAILDYERKADTQVRQ